MNATNKIAGFIKRNRLLNMSYILTRDVFELLRSRRREDFSQHGEDRFLAEYFSSKELGYYVDIGASHPFRISNTYSLYRKGWNGIAVDPIPAFKLLYRVWRPRDKFLNLGIAPQGGLLNYFELIPSVLSSFDANYVESLRAKGRAEILTKYDVAVITPNELFEVNVGGSRVDFMSIDVEGLDLRILQALDFSRFRPGLICVEFNSDEEGDNLINFFKSVDYKIVKTIGCNLFVTDAK
jgi:Methyltransferase FkbM domain